MTHAASEPPSSITFGQVAAPKKLRLNDTEMSQLTIALRLTGPQSITLVRFIEQLPEQP